MSRHDVAIVGAGMAGAGLAAALAGQARVLLLEAEDRPGHHSTGRSAAFWSETCGGRGFFWCAGQGGFGIQTAPAASALAAGLLLGRPAGAIDPAPYSAERFA